MLLSELITKIPDYPIEKNTINTSKRVAKVKKCGCINKRVISSFRAGFELITRTWGMERSSAARGVCSVYGLYSPRGDDGRGG